MGKEIEFVYAEQMFDMQVLLKTKNEFTVIENVQLKHMPLKGDYFIPVGGKETFAIEAIIHDDLQSYIIVTNKDSQYNDIAKNRYAKKSVL